MKMRTTSLSVTARSISIPEARRVMGVAFEMARVWSPPPYLAIVLLLVATGPIGFVIRFADRSAV
jgi:hypothetical protein